MTDRPGRVNRVGEAESIVLRSRQNELATIKKIPTGPAAPFQAFRIQLKPDFEFVSAQGDRVPDGKCPFPFELNSEINAGGFTVLDREASQLIQLCAHALSVQVDL